MLDLGRVKGERFFAYKNSLATYTIVCWVSSEEGQGFVEVKSVGESEYTDYENNCFDMDNVIYMNSELDDGNSITCFRCCSSNKYNNQCESLLGSFLAVDRVNDELLISKSRSADDVLSQYVQTELRGRNTDLFFSNEVFCEDCINELKSKTQTICDDVFWTKVAATNI